MAPTAALGAAAAGRRLLLGILGLFAHAAVGLRAAPPPKSDGGASGGGGTLEDLLAAMRAAGGDLAQQERGCSELDRRMRLTHEEFQTIKPTARQAEAVALGADELVVAAMRRFPESTALQTACSLALQALAQWNAEAFEVLGEHGAVEAIAKAVQDFPLDRKRLTLVGNLAALTDFERDPRSHGNLQRLERTGVTQTVLAGMRKLANDSEVILAGLCFFSNACRPAGIKAKMVEAGYLEDSVEMMRRSARKFGIRGEVVWVADKCLTEDPEIRRRQADAGLLEQVVASLRDANDGIKIDVINNNRAFRNAARLLGKFARGSEEHRERIVRAGAEAEILEGMHSGLVKSRDACDCLAALRPDAELPEGCPPARH